MRYRGRRAGGRWALAPVDLWSDDLQQQLSNSEEGLQQGSSALSLASVMARHGDNLADELIRILRAAASSRVGACFSSTP